MPARRGFVVRWTAPAGRDLESIVAYIAQDHPGNAGAVLSRIRTAGESLAHRPRRGRIVPELRLHSIQAYRELLVPPWRVVYEIVRQIVVVHAVVDSRRSVEDLLLRRLAES